MEKKKVKDSGVIAALPVFPFFLLGVVLFASAADAATLQGTIYDGDLEPAASVLVEINTQPAQRLLSTDGTYSFEIPPGEYFLSARKGSLQVREEVQVQADGVFVFDLFLIAEMGEEPDLWEETQQELVEEEQGEAAQPPLKQLWGYARYPVAAIIILFLLYRFIKARRKYGPLGAFRRKAKEEQAKTLEQHKQDLLREPGHLENAMGIIRKHEGRITQKELRREMLPLSEAKVSLIVTELEHRGMVEKVKKGRGNVILVKG